MLIIKFAQQQPAVQADEQAVIQMAYQYIHIQTFRLYVDHIDHMLVLCPTHQH